MEDGVEGVGVVLLADEAAKRGTGVADFVLDLHVPSPGGMRGPRAEW